MIGNDKPCFKLLILVFLLTTTGSFALRRFASNGPILTVILKDREEQSEGADLKSSGELGNQKHLFNVANFCPNIVWSLKSKGKPLPNWVPNLQSIRTTVGYQYESLKRLPSFIETDFKFSSEKTGIDFQVHPSYEIGSRQSAVVIQASRGNAALTAKFSRKKNRWLHFVKCCCQATLPYAPVGAVRVTPSLDLDRGHPSCLIEATTGSQRTKAILNLEYENPTLKVVHSLNERNTIAPEISLHDASVLYHWNIAMDSGSIRTRVDPTSDIHVTWTDRSMNGKWMTDIKLPLASKTSLSADMRVRRQFYF